METPGPGLSLVCVLDLQCVSGWWLAGVAWYNAINAGIRSVSARASPIITLRARLSAHSTQPKKLCCWWGAAWQWSHVTPARNGWMESYRMSASTYKLGVHMKNWVPLAPILYFVACCDLLIIMVAVRTMAVCLPPAATHLTITLAVAGVGGRHIPMEQCRHSVQCPDVIITGYWPPGPSVHPQLAFLPLCNTTVLLHTAQED